MIGLSNSVDDTWHRIIADLTAFHKSEGIGAEPGLCLISSEPTLAHLCSLKRLGFALTGWIDLSSLIQIGSELKEVIDFELLTRDFAWFHWKPIGLELTEAGIGLNLLEADSLALTEASRLQSH